jgi:hypothetical protein
LSRRDAWPHCWCACFTPGWPWLASLTVSRRRTLGGASGPDCEPLFPPASTHLDRSFHVKHCKKGPAARSIQRPAPKVLSRTQPHLLGSTGPGEQMGGSRFLFHVEHLLHRLTERAQIQTNVFTRILRETQLKHRIFAI